MTHGNEMKLSRRAFLKKVGVGAAAAMLARLLADPPHFAQASETPDQTPGAATWGILIDLTRCIGCHSCALACKKSNNLPRAEVKPQALGSDAYTFVEARQVAPAQAEVEDPAERPVRAKQRYVKRQCMHCLTPACVSACPAAAMYKSELGPVVYRPERCLGCRYCQAA